MGTEVIKTKRLTLRKFNEGDLEAFHNNWASNPNVTKYLSWPAHSDLAVTKMVLDMFINSYKDGAYNWAIVPAEVGEPIGNISVVGKEEDSLELGYCIGEAYWNKGYTTEALEAVIKHLFSEGHKVLIAKHDLENPNSGRVMEKCGMKYYGECYASSNRGRVLCAAYKIENR